MKKIISILLVLLLMLSVAACAAPADSSPVASPSDAAETESAPAETAEAAPSSEASASTEVETHVVTDYLGREVELPVNLTKVCVSDSYNMECINVLGALDSVVGVDWNIANDTEAWGRVYDESYLIGSENTDVNYEAVIEKQPDVLITSEVYDYEEMIAHLEPFGIPVVVCNAYDTTNFFANMELYGEMVQKTDRAQEICDYFQSNLDYVNQQLEGVEKKRVYFEYRNPGRVTIPGDSFYNMLEYAYADNLFKDATSTEVDLEAVVEANPDYIVKVSEPQVSWTYEPPTDEDFARIKDELYSRAGWDEISAVQNDQTLLLSGYVQGGAAKLVGTFYVAKFLYPDLLPDLHPEAIFAQWLEYQGKDYIAGHTRPAFGLED